MKTLLLTFLICLSFQLALANSEKKESLLATLKNSTLMKFSEKPLADLWKTLKPVVGGRYKDSLDQYLAKNKNVQIPELSVTNLYRSQSVESGFRLLIKHPKQIMNIEFINDDHIAAIVNGVPFTHEDMKSFDSIMNKLINQFYASKKKQVSQANQGSLFVWSLFLFSSNANAAESCRNLMGKLCWDQVESESNGDAVSTVKRLMHEKNISPAEIKNYIAQVEGLKKQCLQNEGSCARLEWQHSVLKSVSNETAKGRPQGPGGKQSPAPKEEPKESSAVADFWEDNSSWLKPTLIISGVVLATWGLCRSNVINIFGCAPDDKASTTSTLSSALPVDSTPTEAIYTGTATK